MKNLLDSRTAFFLGPLPPPPLSEIFRAACVIKRDYLDSLQRTTIFIKIDSTVVKLEGFGPSIDQNSDRSIQGNSLLHL